MRHDSINAERLALAWHELGSAASFAMAGAAGVCCFIALTGAFWHLWASRQHINRIKEINGQDSRPSVPVRQRSTPII